MVSECNLCHSADLLPLIDFGEHPISKHLLRSPNEHPPVYPVKLLFCEACGLTQLGEGAPPEAFYDEYLTLSSWKAQPQIAAEVDMLQSLDGLCAGSRILEVGCNDGGFLVALRQAGFTNLLGIDPAKDAVAAARVQGLNVICDYLAPETAKSLGQFDLIVSRHNLEHIRDLGGMVEAFRTLLKPGGYVLVEVPNFGLNLKTRDYSLWEEHVNLFTPRTLRYMLCLAGVHVLRVYPIPFSSESLWVIGQHTGMVPLSPAVREAWREAVAYAEAWPSTKERIGAMVGEWRYRGERIAVYGAGGRAFALLNYLGVGDYLDCILDDQPEKQGKFMPGTGVPIVPNSMLDAVNVCLLAVNPENEDAVIAKHPDWRGEWRSLYSPSPRLL